jgi:acylpyruvate hydrolase
MKIICIARNYALHAKEMKMELSPAPVFFLKPETALVKDKGAFYYPAFSHDVHYETEIVLKICRNGKNIARQFAYKYYNEITIGIDFTARDLQAKCKVQGLPWEMAKAFDLSAPVGKLISKMKYDTVGNIPFHLLLNGNKVQEGNSRDMVFPAEVIIEYVSGFITLKEGDLLFTGTPAGVGSVQPGDLLEGYIENDKILECEVK